MARIAFALAKLRDQVNEAAPKRSKKADGWIGDTAHSKRKSDHNPNRSSVVQALDITHDPKNGMDAHALAETLRLSRDGRIKNVISNGRIFSATVSPWRWRKYTGSNPHTAHVHVSVADDPKKYDDQSAWDIGVRPAPRPAPKPSAPPAHAKPVVVFTPRAVSEETKPLLKSKSAWAAVGTFVASAAGALSDWKVAAVLVVGALVGFLIWDRMRDRKKIKGVLR